MLKELTERDKELIENSLKDYHSAKDDTSKINSLNNICENMMNDDWTKYQFFQYDLIREALKSNPSSQIKKSLLTSLAGAQSNIGFIYSHQGNINLALEFNHKSLKINEKIENIKGIATACNNLGINYKRQGNIPLALEYYAKALQLQEDIGYKKGMATAYNNIGSIHADQGNNQLALEYYDKVLTIREELGDKQGMATSYNNIGSIHGNQGNIPLALEYHSKSLKIREEFGDKKGIANSYHNLGSNYKHKRDYHLALENFAIALQIFEEIGNKRGMATSYSNIGDVQRIRGNNSLALECGLKSLELAKDIGSPTNIKVAAKLLRIVYEQQGKGMKALEMYKLSITMRDSINNQASQKASAQQQAKYEYGKQKAIDDAEHDKSLAIQQEEKEKQKILTTATGTGLGLVVIFLIFVFNRLRVTKKQKLLIEEQKQEVEKQKEVVEASHFQLEEKNQEILDSITYAKRIQSAILPPNKVVKEYLKESFILYKPKDIVAGDFYWLEHREGKILFAAADCTGHGVPGAMVSVLCNNGLNRSVREHDLTDPGLILDKTREIIIQEFEKSDDEVKDGMDIALCSLEGNKLQYAGAHNPLWIIRNGEIIETKGNKQPIGQFDNPAPFTTHNFDLQKGDSIYIFSDGYVDQFGGEKGKKFKAKAFRELLLSIQKKNMEEQKTIIDESFEKWKGNLEQIDDVCVIGVKV